MASRSTDDYAWLKDANWQEVLRDPVAARPRHPRPISKPRTTTPRACSAIPTRLQKKLVAEMRGRIKEDDSSVPAPDGPFAYLRKFREGGQHELFGRMPRDGGETRDHPRRRRAGRGPRLLPVRRRAAFAGPQAARPGAPTSRARNISPIRVRDWADRQRPATTSSRRPTAAWCGARIRKAFFYVKLDDNHRPMQVWRTGSARRRPTMCWSTRSRIPAGSPISMRAPAAGSA